MPDAPTANPSRIGADDVASALGTFETAVARHYPWNLRVNLIYGLFGTTGLRLINAPTLVPDYLYRLGGSNIVVGGALVVGGLCRFLGPLFATALVAHRSRVKPYAIVIGGMMRLSILGFAVAALFLPTAWNLRLFVVFFGLFYFFDGMQSVAYNVVMGKIIPLARRGRFVGLRDFLGGTTVALLALPVGIVLEDVPFPRSYGITYTIALALTAVGLACFALTREPAAPWVTASRGPVAALRYMPTLLRSNRNFAHYCTCRALGSAALMATPFFILYAQQSHALGGVPLGRVTFLFFIAQTAANPLWGRIADWRGFRLVALAAGAAWIACTLILLTLPHTIAAIGLVFALAGAGQGGFRMAAANMVFEFGLDAEFTQRVATVNMIGELASALAPLGAGILADHQGYPAVLWTALGVMVVAQAVLLTGVRLSRDGHPQHA